MSNITATSANGRTADHAIDPLFLERYSPRAFTGEAIPREELMTLLEAARWAPSSYNSQPWRFLYALRETPNWERFLGLLVPVNQAWAQQCAALIVVVSNSVMRPPTAQQDVPSHSHSFDAGAAWACLALQAVRSGWYAHAMIGFDRERAFAELGVPAGFRVEAAVAIGRRADTASLPEALRAKETPNNRRPLSATAFEGGFPGA